VQNSAWMVLRILCLGFLLVLSNDLLATDVGGFIYCDKNNNNAYNSGEEIDQAGLEVKIFNKGTNTLLKTVYTNASGFYNADPISNGTQVDARIIYNGTTYSVSATSSTSTAHIKVVCAATTCSDCTSPNQVTNPTFDSNFNGWTATNGELTTATGGPSALGRYLLLNNNDKSGNYSVYQDVPFGANKQYNYSGVAAKHSSGTNSKVYLEFYNGTTKIGTSGEVFITVNFNTTAFQSYAIDGVTPANTTKIRIVGYCNGTALKMDNQKLTTCLDPPTLTVNKSGDLSCGVLSVQLTATSNPSTGVTYDWTVPSGATDPGNVATFSTSVPGKYDVKVTIPGTGNGCSETRSVTVTKTECTPCTNCTSLNLVTNPTFDTNANGWTAPNNELITATGGPAALGRYLILNNNDKVGNYTVYQDITVGPNKQFEYTGVATKHSSGNNSKVYLEFFNGNSSIGTSNEVFITVNFNTTAFQSYSITGITPANTTKIRIVGYANGTALKMDNQKLTVCNDKPTVTVTSDGNLTCVKTSTKITANATPSSDVTYQWTVPNGVTNPGNVASFNTTVPGTYTVVITIPGTGNGCTATASITVTLSTKPNAGNDQIICEPLATVNLTGFSPSGGTWLPQSGNPASTNVTQAGVVSGMTVNGTYNFVYTLNGCTDTVAVIRNAAPNAGTNGSTSVCDNSVAVINLFNLITGEQAGGTWTRTTGTGGTFNAGAGTFTPAVGATTSTFTYTVTGTAPCPNAQSVATVNISPQPNAGTNGSTSVCDNSVAVINLFSLITGEQAGGTWTRTTGTGGTFNAGAGTFTPAPGATTSTFTYTVTGTAPCPNAQSVATVNITPQPNAGTNGATSVCDNSVAVINLFDLITGEQAGGTWTRTTGTGGTFNAGAGTFTPAPGATTSTFTYTVTGTAPCPNAQSVATVNISPQPNAGTSGSTSVCDNSLTTIDLFSLITGEQAGGTWTRTTGTGGTFNAGAGTFTPAPGATTSTFTYTVTGTAPCPNAQSVATVNISPQPNAGTNGATSVCDNSVAVINLFSLITGEQSGGTWTRTTGTGGTFNAGAGTFTPAVGATTSTFTYTVTGTAPCPNAQSVATVNISPQPNAGTSGSTSVCDNSVAVINLFDLITGEQAGGTWTRTTGTGGTFNAGAGTFTPAAGATTSTFTYTVTGTAPCPNAQSVATVNISPQPNAGTSGSTSVCDNSVAVINLFDLITGEQSGGTWTRTTGTGGTFNAGAGTFTPAVGATTSTFTYTVTGTAPCPNAQSVATVNISPRPNAGTNGSTSVCDNSVAVINLFDLITGEQSGGTWTRTTGTGGTFNAGAGTFTPAAGATTSTFTYTVTGTAPCPNAQSVATVNISPQPNAGTNGSTAICDNSLTTIDLFSLITGEQSGGTWTRTTGTGGTFNAGAGTFTPAAGATTSTFTYTVTGTAPCPNAQSVATVNISPQPNAGTNGSTAICDNSVAVINLFDLITGEHSGGTWTRTTGTGGTFNAGAGTFTPSPGATTSTFTYTVTGTAPCPNAQSVATVNISPQPNAGTNGSTAICDNSVAVINLFDLITGEHSGGTWTRTTGTGGTFNAGAGTFTPAPGATTSTFTYTVTGTAPCPNAQSVATVNISPQPNAGTNGSTSVCDNSVAVINLFDLITGEQSGGTWTRTTGTGGTFNAGAGTFTPAVGSTTSTFTYTVTGTAPCPNAQSVATVNISPQPNAGTNGATSVCDNSLTTIDLFSLITGEQAGGAWTRTTGTGGTFNAGAGTFTPAAGATTSTFTYTVTGTAPCPNAQSVATVNISPKPNAGPDQTLACVNPTANTLQTTTTLAPSPAGGVYTQIGSTPSAATINGSAVSGMSVAGTYQFVYTLNGCTDTVSVTVAPCQGCVKPNAGTDVSICAPLTTAKLTAVTTGGSWTPIVSPANPSAASIDANGAVSGLTAVGTYRFVYSVTSGGQTCTDTASVIRIAKPNAGPDQTLACVNPTANTLQTTTTLAPSPAGGVYTQIGSAPSAATINGSAVSGMSVAGTYQFVYTLNGCTDTVSVTVQPCQVCVKPNAGPDATVCEPATTAKLTAVTPGGVWAPVGSPANPTAASIDAQGNVSGLSLNGIYRFVYSVTGGGQTCTDTASVIRTPQPNAGTNGATSVCDNSLTTIDLFSLITGEQAGGTWTRTTGTGGTFNAGAGTFTPAAGATTSTFTYTVTGTAPCPNAQSVATVNISPQPNAGTNGSTSVCDNSVAVINLFSLITGEQSGGTWTRTTGTGGTFNAGAGTFTPAPGATTSTFTYTVTGTVPCPNAQSVATVNISPQPNAGTNGATSVCDNSLTTIDLFSLITGEQAGGAWTRTTGTGGTFNAGAGTFTPAAGATTSTFTYTVTGTAPCPNAQSVATVNISPKPNAGPDQTLACVNPTANTLQTTTTLAPSPAGGVYTQIGSAPAAATINGSAVSGMSVAGTYQFVYTLNGCTDTVSVTVQPCQGCVKPNAGTDVSICAPLTTAKLTAVTTGGSWTPIVSPANPSAASIDANGAVSGLTAVGTYRFVYSVTSGGQTCTDTASVIRNAKPDAGVDATICAPLTTAKLTAVTSGGTWTSVTNPANPLAASIDASGNVSGLSQNGTYRFVYTLNGCTDTASVIRNPKPDAGPDATVCAPLTTAKLTAVTSGGTWTSVTNPANPLAASIDASGNVSGLSQNGTYRFVYTLNGCTDTASVIRNPKPDAGPDATVCAPLTTAKLTAVTSGGTWTSVTNPANPLAASIDASGNVSGLSQNGTYRFVYTLNGCTDTASVIRNPKPNAGPDQTLACVNPTANTLQTTTTLAPSPAGGVYTQIGSAPSAATINGSAVSGMSVAGTYQFVYTLNGCTDTVSVTVEPCQGCVKPNAGTDVSICAPLTTAKLTAVTTGGSWTPIVSPANPSAASIDANGAVSGLTAVGTYRFVYSVTSGGQTCTDTASVIRNAKPTIADGTAAICAGESVDLTAQITGYTSLLSPVWTVSTASGAAVATPTSVIPTTTTTYVLVAQNAAGCKDTANVVVTVNPKPTVALAQGFPACRENGTSYTIKFTATGGTVMTVPSLTITGDSILVPIATAGVKLIITSATGCKDSLTVTAPICDRPVSSLGDFVFKDLNDNGQQDSGEPGVNGVKVILWSAVGGSPSAKLDSTVTAGNGAYSFVSLLKGDYIVQIDVKTLPDSCLISSKQNVGPDATDNDFTTAGLSPVVSLDPTLGGLSKDNPTIDAGLISPKGSIGDFVWKDLNDNGQQDGGEPGVNGVKVILWKAVGGNPSAKLDSTVTAGNGSYLFSGLKKDNYIVQIVLSTLPDSCLISLKPNVGNDATDSDFTPAGLSPVVSIDPALGGINKDNTTIDAGLFSPKGSIGDFVWKDLNDNGQQDGGEPGVNGVKVILWKAVGGNPSAKLDSTVTAGNGSYLFSGLKKDNYIVQIVLSTLPDSCLISLKPNVGNDATDSDFTPAGLSPVVSIDPAGSGLVRNNTTIDAGLFSPKGSIGDFVWKDLNDNGQQDGGEPGVNGVKVILWKAVGGNPSAKLDSTVTAGNGSYLFSGLKKDNYIVQIVLSTLPDSCLISLKPNVGNDATDSDFTPAGLSPVVSIDPAGSGLVRNNTTIDAGLFSPKGSIGDFVWKDLNDNGQQDGGEPGVNGVKVILWKAVGGVPSVKLDSTVTAGNGAYLFSGLKKDNYIVQIVLSTLPDSCLISLKPNVGNDATDSDFTPAGLSPVVSLDPALGGINKDNTTIDAGLYAPCIKPVIGTTTPTAATCTGTITNSDASITVSGISGGNRYAFATTLAGLAPYASATPLVGSSFTAAGLPNPGSLAGQTYFIRVYNGKNDCFLDATVLVPFRDCSDNCVKPNAGTDVAVCKPVTTVNLPDAAANEEWIAGSANPSAATVNTVTGVVNGLTSSGVYTFILRDKTLGSTCSDTVFIFRGVLELPKQSTCFDTLSLPKIAGATYTKVAGNPASITAAGFVSGMSVPGTVYSFIITRGQCSDTIRVERLNCDKEYDLSLEKSISKKLAMLGDTLTYTIQVKNEGEGTVHGIEVTDLLNAGVQYISSVASMGSYSAASKKWSFDSITVGATMTLTIKVRVVAQGVWFNTAEITKMTEEDRDSTPGNGVEDEDDIDRECFTVPILICRGQGSGVQLNVPAQYSGVVWFRKVQNGQPVQVGTGNSYQANETELGSYEYTFTSTAGTCPAEGCCPIIIAVQDCCPVEVCVPFVITKKKK
jgi:hypothetical protein